MVDHTVDGDTGQRLARLVALQAALADASRRHDGGAGLTAVLATVLDQVIAPDRRFGALVLDDLSDSPRVVANYGDTAAAGVTLAEDAVRLTDGSAAAPGVPVLLSFARELLDDGAARCLQASPGDDEVAAGNDAAADLLGARLCVWGEPVGALVFLAADGFSDDDRLVLEGLAIVVAGALAVRHRTEERRELERLRSDFVSRVSHELRTPLTIISGFAGTLAAHDDSLDPRQRHEMLDRIITAAVRLQHLVEDVLSLASVEAGTQEPQRLVVPVRDVIDLVVHDLGGNGRVEVDCSQSLRVRTDPSLARQTLGPVVENALQHGEQVHVHAAEGEDGVLIAVSDDGPGVPDDLAEQVFDRFVRGADGSPGMGLGLSVARSAGATIGAELRLEPTTAGARFVLVLPNLPELPFPT